MDRRPRKANVTCPVRHVKHCPRHNSYIAQFLLLMSTCALLVGSIAAWSVYDNRSSWREWSTKMRSRVFDADGNRSEGRSSEEMADDLRAKSFVYREDGYADLGKYSVGRYDSITNTTLTVEFQLTGMTSCQDEASFNRFMYENRLAFRDRVTEAVRDCRTGDYMDTTSISKKVVARVNRAFSGRFLESAELADFAVFESVGAYQSQLRQTGETSATGQEQGKPAGNR